MYFHDITSHPQLFNHSTVDIQMEGLMSRKGQDKKPLLGDCWEHTWSTGTNPPKNTKTNTLWSAHKYTHPHTTSLKIPFCSLLAHEGERHLLPGALSSNVFCWNYWTICIRSKTWKLRKIKPSSYRRDWGLQTCRRSRQSLSFRDTGTDTPLSVGAPGTPECNLLLCMWLCLPPPPPISPSLFLHHLPQTMFICISSHSLGSPPTFFSQFGAGQCFLCMTGNEAEWKKKLCF